MNKKTRQTNLTAQLLKVKTKSYRTPLVIFNLNLNLPEDLQFDTQYTTKYDRRTSKQWCVLHQLFHLCAYLLGAGLEVVTGDFASAASVCDTAGGPALLSPFEGVAVVVVVVSTAEASMPFAALDGVSDTEELLSSFASAVVIRAIWSLISATGLIIFISFTNVSYSTLDNNILM